MDPGDSAGLWNAFRERLLARLAERDTYLTYAQPLEILLVAGEAGSHPEFLRVIRDVLQHLQARHEDSASNLELLISEDPAFAAARGAALWQRLRTEARHYCDTLECCPSSQYAQSKAAAGDFHTGL